MEVEKYQPSSDEQMTDEQRAANEESAEDQRFYAKQARIDSGEMPDDEIKALDTDEFLQLIGNLRLRSDAEAGVMIRMESDGAADIELYRLPDKTLVLSKKFIDY